MGMSSWCSNGEIDHVSSDTASVVPSLYLHAFPTQAPLIDVACRPVTHPLRNSCIPMPPISHASCARSSEHQLIRTTFPKAWSCGRNAQRWRAERGDEFLIMAQASKLVPWSMLLHLRGSRTTACPRSVSRPRIDVSTGPTEKYYLSELRLDFGWRGYSIGPLRWLHYYRRDAKITSETLCRDLLNLPSISALRTVRIFKSFNHNIRYHFQKLINYIPCIDKRILRAVLRAYQLGRSDTRLGFLLVPRGVFRPIYTYFKPNYLNFYSSLSYS